MASLDHADIQEINYSLLAFPERVTSTRIAVCGARLYCGFINSVIIWNTKLMKLGKT
jgi:hypothetical protein